MAARFSGADDDFPSEWVPGISGSPTASTTTVRVPSALAGALMLILADLAARVTPTDQELKLGVFTALIGAPLFALIAWKAARSWRT